MGLNLRVVRRSDFSRPRTPSAFSRDWLGSFLFYGAPSTLHFHECVVYLDNVDSDTDVVTTSISLGKLSEESDVAGELHSMSQPSGYWLNFEAEFSSGRRSGRRWATSMAYVVGDYGQSHRARLMMERDSRLFLCGHLQMTTPKSDVVHREGFTDEDMTRTCSIQLGFGRSCDRDRKITIEVILDLHLPS